MIKHSFTATPNITPVAVGDTRPKGLLWLVVAAVLSVILFQFYEGRLIMYPFTILATWFHEMGHGITAMLLGATFDKLEIFSNGSGVAHSYGEVFLGNLGNALVAAGGLMAPPIAGSIFIMTGRTPKASKISLMVLSVVLFLSVVIWVRTLFGVCIISAFAMVIFAIAHYGKAGLQQFTIQFLGVQACINTYFQLSYLFMASAVINGQTMHSDTGSIAQNLFLPYWFWGGLIAISSFALLLFSLYKAYK
jgi:hypothetical protein